MISASPSPLLSRHRHASCRHRPKQVRSVIFPVALMSSPWVIPPSPLRAMSTLNMDSGKGRISRLCAGSPRILTDVMYRVVMVVFEARLSMISPAAAGPMKFRLMLSLPSFGRYIIAVATDLPPWCPILLFCSMMVLSPVAIGRYRVASVVAPVSPRFMSPSPRYVRFVRHLRWSCIKVGQSPILVPSMLERRSVVIVRLLCPRPLITSRIPSF